MKQSAGLLLYAPGAEGLSVLTGWAAGKFDAEKIAGALAEIAIA